MKRGGDHGWRSKRGQRIQKLIGAGSGNRTHVIGLEGRGNRRYTIPAI